jgi:hypothetical protein
MKIRIGEDDLYILIQWIGSTVEEMSVFLPRDRRGEVIVDTSHTCLRWLEGKSLLKKLEGLYARAEEQKKA